MTSKHDQVLSDNIHSIIGMVYPVRDRWQDEREYEDWADYEKHISNVFAKFNISVVKVTKRFAVTLDDGFVVRFNANNVTIEAPAK